MNPATRRKFGLPRNERLRGKATFDLFFKHANQTRFGVLKCYYTIGLPELEPPARVSLAVVAPKKLMKRAHDRNRAKRLMREAFRLHAPTLLYPYLPEHLQPNAPKIVLMVVYTSPQHVPMRDVSHCMGRILSRIVHDLKRKYPEPPRPDTGQQPDSVG